MKPPRAITEDPGRQGRLAASGAGAVVGLVVAYLAAGPFMAAVDRHIRVGEDVMGFGLFYAVAVAPLLVIWGSVLGRMAIDRVALGRRHVPTSSRATERHALHRTVKGLFLVVV